MIEDAYTQGPSLGLAVWCEDEAGPFQAIPHPGTSWQPEAHPARHPHEYVRGGTAKVLTLFHPADGRVRIEGTRTCPNTVLHPWLQRELADIVAQLPALPPTADTSRAAWERWQTGLTIRITLPDELPPLRVLLVLDNLVGHKTPALVLWLFAHGIMPLFTPLGGSWLNMAESIQRVLKRRALSGQHPTTPDDIMARFAGVAKHWNAARRRSCGAANGRPAARGNGSDAMPSAGPGPAPGDRSDGVMATGEACDPLVFRHT